jgi:hypothetical protein
MQLLEVRGTQWRMFKQAHHRWEGEAGWQQAGDSQMEGSAVS